MNKENELPKMSLDNSETGCCPKFNPEPWDEKSFVFDKKLFVKAKTRNFLHIPLNMGSVIPRTWKKIEQVGAGSKDSFLMLSYDPSPWTGEHYFSAEKEVSGEDMVSLSGTFLTKVFEGPFKDAKKWVKAMEEYVKSKGKSVKKLYFFYTTCPKCAKHFCKNYVVAFAEI